MSRNEAGLCFIALVPNDVLRAASPYKTFAPERARPLLSIETS